MARTARASNGGYVYHVLNRGNGRQTVFHKDGDFVAFINLMREAHGCIPMRDFSINNQELTWVMGQFEFRVGRRMHLPAGEMRGQILR